jgi:hypothetical protein
MRVPQIRFAETRVPEAEWNIGIAWLRQGQQTMLVENFIHMARRALSSTIK